MYNQSELMHYGVLGMKWGVRKSRISNSVSSFKGRSGVGVSTVASSKPKKMSTSTKRKIKIGSAAVATSIGIIGGSMLIKNAVSDRNARNAISRILKDNGSDPLALSYELLSRGRR